MKIKKLLLSSIVLGGMGYANAAVTENFGYVDGTLAGQNGGTGSWSSPWMNSFSSSGGEFVVSGGTAMSPGARSRHSRQLDQSYGSGTIFVDFTIQIDNTTNDPFSALELSNGAAGDNNRVISIGVLRGDDADPTRNFYIRSQQLTTNNSPTFAVGEIAAFNNGTNRIVARFDLDAETVNVFFNPTGSDDLLAAAGAVQIGLANGTSFDTVALANFPDNGTASPVAFDNISIGVVPEPTTTLLGLLGGLFLIRRKR